MLAKDYALRWEALMNLLPKGATVIVYGRKPLLRLPTVPVPFNQFSDILYLTGEPRPGCALTIENWNNGAYSTLFLPKPDREAELWEGFRTSFEEGQQRSGVERVLPMSEFDDWISRNTPDTSKVFCSFPPQQSYHKNFQSLKPFIDKLRVVKSAKEQNLIRKACAITKTAMEKALADAKPGMRECEVAARFELEAVKAGATGLAYPIECQSGRNALCLHYIDNLDTIKDPSGLLMDAGCEYQYYAFDFTRTIAVGKAKDIQKDAIAMVESTKNELVQLARSGAVESLCHLNEKCRQMLMKCLQNLHVKVDARAKHAAVLVVRMVAAEFRAARPAEQRGVRARAGEPRLKLFYDARGAVAADELFIIRAAFQPAQKQFTMRHKRVLSSVIFRWGLRLSYCTIF